MKLNLRLPFLLLIIAIVISCDADKVLEESETFQLKSNSSQKELSQISIDEEKLNIISSFDFIYDNNQIRTKSGASASTIILPEYACSLTNGVESKYMFWASLSNVKLYDREVNIVIWKNGSPILSRNVLVMAGEGNSVPVPFFWESNSTIGVVNTSINLIKNLDTGLSEIDDYITYAPSFDIKNCTYKVISDPIDNGWDSDGDGINDDIDDDSNGNGIPDIFEN